MANIYLLFTFQAKKTDLIEVIRLNEELLR